MVKGTYDELRGLKIPKNPQRQGAIVQKKLALLDRLKEGLKQVVKFDDAYQVVAALTLQGQGLQHMSAALYNAPAPSGLNAEQLNVYKTEVEKLAKPLLDQALESYKAAISRGIELGGYNDWLLLAMKELNRVDANQYRDFNFKIFLLEQMDDSRLGKSISGSSAETSSVDEMRKAWRKGKKSEILDSISNVLDQDSNHLEALNLLGIYYYKQRSPGLARLVFERAQSAHPKTPALHNNLGILELSEGDQRQAILQLKSAIALKSSYEVAVSNLSSIYLKYRDYKRALGPLEDSYRETKRDLSQGDEGAVRIASNYAAALTGSGDPKRAKSVYENVLDGKSRDIDVMMNYAILLVRVLKEKKEAVRVLSKIKFVSDNSQVLGKVKDLEQELEQLD